jgi:hypothetical protein
LEWKEYGITPVFFRIVRSHGLGPDDYSNLTALVADFGAELGLGLGLDPIRAFTGRMLEL